MHNDFFQCFSYQDAVFRDEYARARMSHKLAEEQLRKRRKEQALRDAPTKEQVNESVSFMEG